MGNDSVRAESGYNEAVPQFKESMEGLTIVIEIKKRACSVITGKALERYFALNDALREFALLFQEENNERAQQLLVRHSLTRYWKTSSLTISGTTTKK